VTVLEAEEHIATSPRASTFHSPTLEMLDALGVAQPFLARGFTFDRFQFREYGGDVVAEFDLSRLADVTRFPFRLQCPQDWLAEILLDEVRATGLVEVRFGARVVDFDQDEHGVRVVAETKAGRETVAGSYLIGADGARSAVRSALDISFSGMSYPVRQLQMMTTLDLRRYIPDLCGVTYVLDPDEWFILLRTPPGVWRALVPVPEAFDDDPLAETAWLQDKVRRLVRDPEAPVDVVYRAVYTAHQRVADRYRVGRVLIAGDAAHVNTPFGGMGVNCGIHDAYFLAPLLARALEDPRDDALDLWAEERRRIALDYVQTATAKNARDASLRDEAERRARNEQMRATASDPATARAYVMRSSMMESILTSRLTALSDLATILKGKTPV
jgi:3-(3-hydroxy-phenyl)propionate hydroxylase